MKKLLLASTLFLVSCATHLTQQQCISTNWELEGYKDGSQGQAIRDLTQAAQDCQAYKIAINRDAYVIGWNKGMKIYCTPDFNLGVRDGQLGKSAYEISDRNPSCLQAGLNLNARNYEQGRRRGLLTYCTYGNGLSLGRQGKAMPEVCPQNSQFYAGYNNGTQQLCNQSDNAYALGKSGQAYPEACDPKIFYAFKSEYDRGASIAEHIHLIEQQKSDLQERITDLAWSYHLRQIGDHYDLGSDKSASAQQGLSQVNNLLQNKRQLENELFNLRAMR
jgi:hypothetical protein